jgi:transitional endoplasmic reticulum ATPase
MKSVEFKIVEVEPGPYAIVGPDTLVDCKGDPIKRRDESKLTDVGYDDVGGVSKQLGAIRETVELPLKHVKLFTTLGVPMPRGVLLYGPPGCGKTLLARAVANETGAYLVMCNGPEIMGLDKKEDELIKRFEEAQDNAPSIIFIDEIETLAPRREHNTNEATKRMVSCLLLQIDALNRTELPVIIIGATNVPGAVDGSMRRFGRFDRELDLGVPDDQGRLEILHVHTRNMKLAPDVDLKAISKDTHGYVGADISQLTMEAALQCIRESIGALNLEADELDSAILDAMAVNKEHFKHALKATSPSSLREMVVQIPNVSWDKIGGLEDVKMELQELVQYPVEHPEKFEQFGMEPSRGVLFYGPPGCGKTLMAKAVANECQANFISVKGPELLNAYFGESEANVRMVFERARAAAPCVLFFDELDSIAVARGSGNSSNGAMDRVINQLLTEIDGVGAKKNVFVIGATNRPDIIDAALMRPGRLDQLMYIPMPDYGSRLAILKATFKKAKLDKFISLEYLAEQLDGYTGADISEICQHAAKIAIKQNIEEEIKKVKGLFTGEPIQIITADHLEAAVRTSRKSVSEEDLAEYASFAHKMKRMQEEAMTAGGSSMAQFSFNNQFGVNAADRGTVPS